MPREMAHGIHTTHWSPVSGTVNRILEFFGRHQYLGFPNKNSCSTRNQGNPRPEEYGKRRENAAASLASSPLQIYHKSCHCGVIAKTIQVENLIRQLRAGWAGS